MSTPLVDVIRLGPATKIRLTTLKRRTGIENWNVLCRWAFCLSVSDAEPISERNSDNGSAIEMTWKTFAGDHEEIYEILLRSRLAVDAVVASNTGFAGVIRSHVIRGVSRLTAIRGTESVQDLLQVALERPFARDPFPASLQEKISDG